MICNELFWNIKSSEWFSVMNIIRDVFMNLYSSFTYGQCTGKIVYVITAITDCLSSAFDEINSRSVEIRYKLSCLGSVWKICTTRMKATPKSAQVANSCISAPSRKWSGVTAVKTISISCCKICDWLKSIEQWKNGKFYSESLSVT